MMNDRFANHFGWYVRRTTQWLIVITVMSGIAAAADRVRATMATRQAWAGQPVQLIVTLYSPGPFSGTPSFDLPEIPSTVIVRVGRTVVGNETVDDESWFTQRHELNVFTQQVGEVTIPSFSVRFQGKPTFTSPPESMQGLTPALTFQSRQPPGIGSMERVLAAAGFDVSQTWEPEGEELSVRTGDVVQRNVLLQADGTTSMMLPAVPSEAPQHVRVYASDSELEDRTSRGESASSRRKSIKYQFEQPGTFQLPDLKYAWWDYEAESLKREVLEGRTIIVTEPVEAVPAAEVAAKDSAGLWTAVGAVVVTVICLFLYRPASALVARLKSHWNTPESMAGRRIMAACRTNDASAAYAASLAWKRLVGMPMCDGQTQSAAEPVMRAFENECETLAAMLFGTEARSSSWSGASLRRAFSAVRREQRSLQHQARRPSALTSLNPDGLSGDRK